jgi:hypothetical protein
MVDSGVQQADIDQAVFLFDVDSPHQKWLYV